MCGRVLTGGRAHQQYCNAACRTRASQGRRKAQVGEALTETRTDVERLAAADATADRLTVGSTLFLDS